MQFVQKKWVCFIVLLAFIFESVFVVSYEPWALKNLLLTPFKIVSYVLSPDEAIASAAPDPDDYTINKIPEYFIDISGSGTELTLSDDGGFSGIPIGFDFDFYGITFNSITVTANGYLTFSLLVSSQNTPIPSAQTPDSLIAPFWDDLNPELNAAGAVYFETTGDTPNRTFIVQWNEIPLKADPDSHLTFEVVLFEGSNEIQFHYLSMTDGSGSSGSGPVSGNSATIGIENADGTRGTEISCNGEGAVTGGSAFSLTLGGNAYETGRKLGDLDNDDVITILDQSVLTDKIIGLDPLPSSILALSDIAPQPGLDGRPFGDGVIDDLDHERIFEAVMQRENLNPTLSGTSYYIAPAGETVTIYGSGFNCVAGNNTVYFVDINGVETAVTADSINAGCTELTVTVPTGLEFITSIRVEHNGLSSNSVLFVLEAQPLITAITPDGGEEGDVVLIRGYEFGPAPVDNQVSFNGIAASVNSVSATDGIDELNVTVPAGVTTGPVTVTVAGKVSNGVIFTVDGPPIVSINSPAADTEITGPTDIIGTASDLKLVSYTLEYSPAGENNFITFAAGSSPVTNGVLGTFDPTLLLNDLYTVRLTAVDADGRTSSTQAVYQVKGDMKVGNFTITLQDIAIPVAGIPITINRTYDSRDKGSHDFGYGWSIDIQTTKIKENRIPGTAWTRTSSGGLLPTYCFNATAEHYVSITMPDGKVEEFDMTMNPYCQQLVPLEFTNVEFTPRPGTNSTLEAIADNYVWYIGGVFLDFDTLEPYDPSQYKLTRQDGTVFIIDETSGVKSVTDPNGNKLTFTSGGIIHSSGKSITFDRDAKGRITRITDPMGNVIDYTYDAQGDLVSVTDQEGYTSEYTYNTTHGLVDIIDPRGITPARNEYDDSGRLIAHTDANGNRIEYTHNIEGRQEIVRDRNGNQTVYIYDNSGNVLSKTDPLGSTTTYTYDTNGNKLSETDPIGNTTAYTYDAQDNLLTKTDALGNTTGYTYNTRGQVLTTTDPLGNVTVNTYDGRGNLLTTTDALGNATTNTYDAGGNLLTTTDPHGNVTSYAYDSSGNMISQTDALGNTTTYTYDANGNQLTQTVMRTTPSGTETLTTTNVYDGLNRLIKTIDAYGNFTTTEYNPIGKKSAVTDKNGNRTTFEYGVMGNLIKTTYPDGTTETSTYDANGNRITFTDRNGRMTTYTYDVLNRLISTTYPDGSSTGTTYDAAGRVISTIDARGNTATYSYDAAGRRTSVTDTLGNASTYTYDAKGNRLSFTDANGNTTTYEYDAKNRRTKTIFADGTFSTTAYDSIGRKISETDQAGVTTGFAYDALGRLTSVTDALGQVTSYTYDALGNKITQTDANGNATKWEYDGLGRVIKRTLPLGMSESFVYDAVDNMLSKTDFDGNTTTFTYDVNNRLLTRTFPDSSSVSFTYTSTGQRSTVTDSRGVTTYSYDASDRLTQVVEPDGTAISYTYDAAGNRTSVTVPSGVTTYTYDVLNRLQTATDPNGGVTAYTYDNAGNRAGVTYPNGSVTSYTYDTLNRLTYLKNRKSTGEIISSYTYTLGPAGNRLRVVEDTGRIVDYTYDDLYRLTEEDITDAVLGNQTISYTYDPVGNRLTKVDSIGITNYIYDANDRLISEGSNIYTYDNNGNTLSRTEGVDTTIYNYDYENRLKSAQTPNSAITYKYDADGIRVRSAVDGTVTNYLVDKNRDYAQVLEETDDSGTLIVSYVYGDDLISQNRSGAVSYYHYDGLGSTRILTDNSETITDTYTYEAFGILLGSTGSTVNNYLFTGEQYDPNVGFYYLRARYYDAETARFKTIDPVEGKIYDPKSLHKYLYVANDPINKIDPSGEYALTLTSVMITISIMDILSAVAITIAIVGIIEHFRKMPIRLNHYTEWSVLPLIMLSGINSPSGKNYFTPDWYFDSKTAKSRLALPNEPEVFINLTLYLKTDGLIGPSTVDPAYSEPGGGLEYYTWSKIPYWTRMPIIIPLF